MLTFGSGNAWADEVTLTYDGTGSFPRNSSWSSGGSESSTYKHSGTYCAMFATTSAQYITYNVDLTDISSITLWGYRNSSNTTHPTFAVEGSTDGGSSWTTLVAASTFTLTRYSWVEKTINISPAFTGRVRLKYSCGSTAQKFIDDVTITYTPSSSCSTNPTVGASGNSSISVTGATVSCTGITKGDCDIDEWGFVYGTATEPTGNVQKVSSGKSTSNVSSFNKTLTGLDPNVKYYVRAYAKVGSSTFYGSETNFTTKTITASSSNTTYGTVSRSKMVITGSPKSGGQYASPAYTVTGSTPANATTVTQSGNTFTVTSTSTTNITITINFEAIPTYTVTWVAGSNSSFNSQTGTAGTALTDPGTPSAASYCPGGKVFVGWTATPIDGEQNSAPADLFTSVSGKSIPSGGTTYYAVFATAAESSTKFKRMADLSELNSASKIAFINSYSSSRYILNTSLGAAATTPTESDGEITVSDGQYWTLESSNSNWKFKTGTDYLVASTIPTSSSKSGAVSKAASGNTEWVITSNSYTSNGTPVFTVYSAASSTAGLEYSSGWLVYYGTDFNTSWYTIRIYVPKKTYSAYATTCCTPLGTINGSVNFTNPTKAVLVWDAVAHVDGWTAKWKTGAGSYATTNVSGVRDTLTNKKTCVVTGLSCNTAYDFKIIATPASGYCDKEQEITNQNSGQWDVTYTLSNASRSSGQTAGTDVLCGDLDVVFGATTGYVLPNAITVTGASSHSWTQATGTLHVDAANITGNIAVSFTATAAACTGVNSLHTGNKDQGGWVTNQCFEDADWGAADDAIYVGAFPLTNECYVGWAGGGSYYGTNWAVGGIKTYDIPTGRTLGWNSGNYYQDYPGGALGTFHIYKNSKDENYYLRFKPSSYILRTGSDETSWTSREMTVSATNSHYYETAELDLTSTLISEHAYVDLKTNGGDGHVWCNFSNNRTASGNVKVKSSVGDADGNFRGDNLKASDNGTHGKFRIDITKDVDNWKLAFVPMYRITYAAGTGASGSMAPSSYAEISTNIAAAANDFTAPTGKQFNGWSDGVNTYSAGDNVTMNSNVTLTAQWTDIDYTVTMAQSPNAGASLTGGTSTAHYNNTINITTTVPDGYIFSGWTASPSVTFASSSSTSTSFTMPASDVTITASFTRIDTYIDNIWNTATQTKTGTYTRPTLSDQTPGGLTDCQHLHYHFVGWITKAKYDAGTTIDARTAPTGDLVAGGSVTANGSTYYAVWEKATATVSTDFELVTSSSAALADGDQIIIATSGEAGEAKAMGYSRGNNRAAVDVTIASGLKIENPTLATLSSDQDYIYPLQLVANSTFFNIKDKVNDKYLAATGNTSNNYLNLLTDGDDNRAKFTISVAADGVATITANITGTNIRNKMKYNSGNNPPIISCYNSGQSAVYIYRKPGVSYEDPVASCGAEYTITIDKNNASAACSSCGAKVNANAVTLSNLVAPTWTGHQVDYYMIASADNSTKIAEADGSLAASVTDWTDGDGKWIKGSDATIYAEWKYAEYEIAYYDQGGSAFSGVHGADHPTTHTYNTATTLVNPTKNGYNFAGWYTSSDCSTGLVTSLGATAYTSGPINLYAKWTLKTYDVTWVVNGSTVATQTSVTYGTTYEDLSSTPSNPADNALSSCGSDRFVGWVTAEYTSEGGTKVSQYDPYAVTNSTVIDDTHHTFYAMFAKESGTAFSLSVTSGDFKISGLVDGVNYYATGALDNGKYAVTTTAGSGDDFTFTKVSDGVYTIKHKRSNKFVTWSSSTNFGEADASINWTITAADHGSWSVIPATATTRAFVMNYSSSNPENSVFKPYATSNVTNTPAQYYYIEIGTSTLTNYRTGCCSETITLTVSDATSGAGGTVAMKWNNASKSNGDAVSTCSTGTLVVDVTANPSYTLTAITIAGTNKTITLDPDDLITGLPSTSKMTYTVSVPSLATGTLTITPTFTRTYSVTYDLDGGETAGSTDVVNYQSGATVTLVTPDPTRSGYDFTGWTVTKDGGGNVSVSAGQFTMPTDNVTATAGWAAKTLSSISVAPTTAEVYVGQYVQIPVTYDPADILTKGYTLVSTPSFCVTTGSTNTTLKITGGRGGVTITENKIETVSIKATADNTKTASVTVTVKPLPVDHFVDLIHGEIFADHAATIVDNNLSTAYSAPGHTDVDAPLVGNDCEKQNLHLVGWIESEWANTHLTATMLEFMAAEDNEHNPLFFETYAPMNVSGKTYYAVWAKEVTP